MALNPQWIEERKEWICLTPIFGLCSQTLLCLIWGVGTGFVEHKGKNAEILCPERECVGFRGSSTAGAALETGVLFLGWQFEKFIPCQGGTVSGVLVDLLGNPEEGASQRPPFEMWMIRGWIVSVGERKREGGGDTLSLSLWSDHVYPFHSPRHQGFCFSL